MSSIPLTRQQVDAAGELDFNTKRPSAGSGQRKPDLLITIRAVFDGYPIEIQVVGSIEMLGGITKRLKELGAEPARFLSWSKGSQSNGPFSSQSEKPAQKAAQKAAAVSYADDGSPICDNPNCSRRGKPLTASQHGSGSYCSGKDATTGNAKGYCKTTAD